MAVQTGLAVVGSWQMRKKCCFGPVHLEIPGAVFVTLLEVNCSNLSRIAVEVEDAKAWFLPENRNERAQ